jgi:hypothetical protein
MISFLVSISHSVLSFYFPSIKLSSFETAAVEQCLIAQLRCCSKGQIIPTSSPCLELNRVSSRRKRQLRSMSSMRSETSEMLWI